MLKSVGLSAALLALVLMSSVASAQTHPSTGDDPEALPVPPPPPMSPPGIPTYPRNPEDLRSAVCMRPSRAPLMAAHAALPKEAQPQRVVVLVRYEDDGSMSEVRIERSSGDRTLDAAVLAWARRVRLCPGRGPGEGKLPIEFPSD
jgi:periplasmic protein TonB